MIPQPATRSFDLEELTSGAGYRVVPSERPYSIGSFLIDLRESHSVIDAWSATLAAVPLRAYRLEFFPVANTSDSWKRPFRAVLLADELTDVPNRAAFASHFAAVDNAADPRVERADRFDGWIDSVTTFANLGGDARLVVPCPVDDRALYPHLAAFVRTAPVGQQRALWQWFAIEVLARPFAGTRWLSTAGAGVAWLHLRIDTHPKYVRHTPFRDDPYAQLWGER